MINLKKEEIKIDKTSTLCRLFNELYKEGKRNVNAVFDFGYTEVGVKLNLPSDSSGLNYHYIFFGGTKKSHDAFEREYFQPISMVKRDTIEFLPFIKEIKVGKKTVYEDEIDTVYVKENQLMNLISNSSWQDHNEEILQLINAEEINAAILDEHHVVHHALCNFYISLEVFEALKNIGCNIYAKGVQELLDREKYFFFFSNLGFTRDLSEIVEKYYTA